MVLSLYHIKSYKSNTRQIEFKSSLHVRYEHSIDKESSREGKLFGRVRNYFCLNPRLIILIFVLLWQQEEELLTLLIFLNINELASMNVRCSKKEVVAIDLEFKHDVIEVSIHF